jgi:ABC-type sulfate transport system permease component
MECTPSGAISSSTKGSRRRQHCFKGVFCQPFSSVLSRNSEVERVGRLQTIRYLVVLVTGFIAGSRAVDAAQSWREWRNWAATDPSQAEAYRTFFLTNAATATLSLVIAALVWWLLRPHAPR